jgi:hypothetical protein
MPVPAGPRRAAPPRRRPPVPTSRSEEATDASQRDKVGEEVDKSDFLISEKEEAEKVQKEASLPGSGSGEEGPSVNVVEQVAVTASPPVHADVGHADSQQPHEGETIMPSETDVKRNLPIGRSPPDTQSNAAFASIAAVPEINEVRDTATDKRILDASKINEEPSYLPVLSEQESKQELEQDGEENENRNAEEEYPKPPKHNAEWLANIGGINPLVGLAAPGRSHSTDDSELDIQDPEKEERLEYPPVETYEEGVASFHGTALPTMPHPPGRSAPIPEVQEQIHPSAPQMGISLDDPDTSAQDEHQDGEF